MRLRVITVVILMAMTSAACTPQDAEPEPPAGEQPETSPPEVQGEEAAVEAYESMWDVVVEASHAGDPDPEALEQFASGDALALMRQTLQGAAEDEADVEGEPFLDPEVVEASPEEEPDTVVLLDCADGSQWMEEASEDADESATPSGKREIDATVINDGLSWRVSELRIWEPGTC